MIKERVGSGWFRAILVLVPVCFSSVFAVEIEKPVVAIKMATIGEGVSDYSRKHLNLSTILSEMEASIQRNRKFSLVSRQEAVMEDIRKEQNFANSELSSGNAAAEGQLKSANFLILPTVQDFKFYRAYTAVPNLNNKYVRTDSGMLEINVQVVDTSSGAIKSTFYLKDSFATGKKVVNGKRGAPNSVHFTKMAKSISGKMTDQLVDIVFPMQVLAIQGNQVFINRGQDGGLKTDQKLKVFRPGIELIDPDTGENLGSAETLVGTIQVARINPKFTIANVVEMSVNEVLQKGDIVRMP